jgi:hypothetical protein
VRPVPSTDHGAVADRFRHFARNRTDAYAPLYARLAEAMADEPALLAIAAIARPGQSRPDLLLTCVHYLLHDHLEHPAARFYPSLTDDPDREHDPVPDVLAFCRQHEDQLRDLVAHRLVQTNEVNRCAFLLPAFQVAARYAGGPIAVIEIGASAGLNLRFDNYRYRYTDPANETWEVGDQGAAVTVKCALRGPHRPALDHVPRPAWRLGIDLNPLDPSVPEDRRWLRASVWPDHPSRLRRLDAAIRWAAGHPVTVLPGDAATVLPEAVDLVPDHATLIVYHTAVLAHMTETDRARFTAALLGCSVGRPILWVNAEPRTDGDDRRLRMIVCDNGVAQADRPLGRYQPHGEWVELAGGHA